MTMKTIRTLTTIGALLVIGYLGSQVVDAAQERFIEPIIQSTENTALLQNPSFEQDVVSNSETSLDDAVYDSLRRMSIDKNGQESPLRLWGKPISKIPEFKQYISTIVTLTEQACQQYQFPDAVNCPELIMSLVIQESQLTNHGNGIAQMTPDTAGQYLNGPKYNAWQAAKRTREAYEQIHPVDKQTSRQRKQDLTLKQNEQYLKNIYSAAAQRILKNPAKAIPLAVAHVHHLVVTCNDLRTALGKYNCGEYRPIPAASKEYARNILARYTKFSNR